MVPLSALASVRYSSGPDTLDRFNNLPAVKIFGAAAPGYSSGQAIERMEKIAQETLPPDFSFDWSGLVPGEALRRHLHLALGSRRSWCSSSSRRSTRNWSLPLSVMLALPFGTFGALAAVWLRGIRTTFTSRSAW